MTREELFELGMTELKQRGYGSGVTWNIMHEWLMNGYCSQDDFELYDDTWNISAFHFSVPDYAMKKSEENLRERFREKQP